MTTLTKRDAIESAMSIADDVAQGRLTPAALGQQAVAELREMFGTVAGPDDPVWPLQVDVARQVLALDGVPADELSEWLAVQRHRAGEPVNQPCQDETTPPAESSSSGTLSADSEHVEQADAEPEQLVVADAEQPVYPTPPRRADVYDPLTGWSPGRTPRG